MTGGIDGKDAVMVLDAGGIGILEDERVSGGLWTVFKRADGVAIALDFVMVQGMIGGISGVPGQAYGGVTIAFLSGDGDFLWRGKGLVWHLKPIDVASAGRGGEAFDGLAIRLAEGSGQDLGGGEVLVDLALA